MRPIGVNTELLQRYQAKYPDLKIKYEVKGLGQIALRGKFRYENGELVNRNTGQRFGGNGPRRKYKGLLLSRYIFLYCHGWVPEGKKYVIDHIDNNKLNDSIENLQVLHFIENMNKDLPPDAPKRAIRTSLRNGTNYIFNMGDEAQRIAGAKGRETQKRKGIGIFDPARRLGMKGLETQKRKGIGIFDPKVRKLGHESQRRNKTGFHDPELMKSAGAKGRETQKRKGIGFYDPEMVKRAWAKRKASIGAS